MFERYTEKARRVIFFARYEASQYGSPYIETEHLLLGLLREDKALTNRFLHSHAAVESIRKQVDNHTVAREKTATSVDLPLSNESKRVLKFAADEADDLHHNHIGTEHLLLGLLREEGCFAAAILRERGISLEQARSTVGTAPLDVPWRPPVGGLRTKADDYTVELHGQAWSVARLRALAAPYRAYSFHWEKKTWAPRDIVVGRKGGMVSFDLALTENPDFELVKGGWTRDHCLVCHWELCASKGDEHSTGYTNGRDWLCTECYEKLWARPDFFAGGYRDLT